MRTTIETLNKKLLNIIAPDLSPEESAQILNSPHLVKPNNSSLITALEKYNILKNGVEKLKLQEKSVINYMLPLLFNSFDSTKLSVADIERIFEYLAKHGVMEVCQISQSIKPSNSLSSAFLFLCLENIVYAPRLLDSFHFLAGREYSSLCLVNETTIKLFNQAPAQAKSVSDLLFLLWENRIYRPGDASFNQCDGAALINDIHQHIENLDDTLSKLRKLSKGSKPITEEIVRNSISHKNSAAFEESNNLIDESEDTLELLQKNINDLNKNSEKLLIPIITKIDEQIFSITSEIFSRNSMSKEENVKIKARFFFLRAAQHQQIKKMGEIFTQNKIAFFFNPPASEAQLENPKSYRRNSI